jgi:hypothetical protein
MASTVDPCSANLTNKIRRADALPEEARRSKIFLTSVKQRQSGTPT